MNTRFIILLSFFLVLVGCATIVGQPTQLIPISSKPEGASIIIKDETGLEIFKGTTPTSVTLQKSDGTYWGGKSFTAHLSKEGFETIMIPIKASPNGWYIAGNVIFGGLIGWFIVDPMNGDMYTLSKKEINASLVSSSDQHSKNNGIPGKRVSFVLLDDVPVNLRSKMKKIN